MYKVYKHTTPSKKVYIGITNQKPERRWGKNGRGYKDNDYFYKAIQKYGWNNIEHEILFDGLTEEEACLKEIELIEKYNSADRSCGYNHHLGGKVHDTVSRDDLQKGNFKPYSEIIATDTLHEIFKKVISSALGFEYFDEIKILDYENDVLVKKHTTTICKVKKPSYFAICFLLEHYSDAEEVVGLIPQLEMLKHKIEQEL